MILISVLLALLLILKEVRRKSRKNLFGRLVASVLALIALVLIALPPTIKTSNRSEEMNVVLLTDGFSKDSLARVSSPLVLSTDSQLLRMSGARNKLLIPAIDYYLAENPNVQNLHIVGSGLETEELKMLKGIRVEYNGTQRTFGFQSVNWPEKIQSGTELWVSGSFNNNSRKEVKVLLKGLGTTLDSVVIGPDSLNSFKLSCVPRQLGTSLNYLIATSGKDTLFTEKIPFEVGTAKPLAVLILSSSPDFELNFLKQWLAGSGFSVAIRNRISTGKFSTEFLNMDGRSLNLQPATLKTFDVLIADETAMIQLTGSERAAVKNQVNAGLGIIIRNEEETTLRGIFGASFSTSPVASEETLSLRIPGNKLKSVLPGTGVNSIASQNYDQPLVWDQKNRIMVNSIISGVGRIIFSTLNNTYTWKLAGRTAEYSSFWSYLVEKASRKKPRENITAEQFPLIHKRTTVLLEKQSSEIPGIFTGATRINLEQNADLPYRWQGSFWPTTAGWNLLKTPGSENHSVYIFNDSDWKTVRQAENSRSTKRFAEGSGYKKGNLFIEKDSVEKIPVIFFYLLLLICWGYLWIETKFL